jgi:hypothetical protein
MATRIHVPSIGVYYLRGGRNYVLFELINKGKTKIGSPFLGREFTLKVVPYMDLRSSYQVERVKK